MAVMDEFKEERAALKNGTFKEKLNYFWYYYKWHVIGITVAVLLIVSFIHQIVTRKETAFNAVMLNVSPMTTEETYLQEFADYAGIDTEEYEMFFDTSIRIFENSADEISYTSVQKLMVYTAAAELDTMVTDTDSFAKYANSYSFYDLRDILTAEQLAKYEPYFYYVDLKTVEALDAAAADLSADISNPVYPDPTKPEDMESPIPVGIYLDFNEVLKENYYFRGENVVMGVYCNTTHLDTSLKFIDFLMQEAE